MLLITDFKVDNSDDIIINGDMILDNSPSDSAMRVAERRIVARGDDFRIDDISAALEKSLFQTKNPFTIEDIKISINNVLLADRLFVPSDFSIHVIDSNDKTLYITLIFRNALINEDNRFKIVVDIENQKIYRG